MEHQIPDPSSLALSAMNMIICLRTALPNLRLEHLFATRQLMLPFQAAQRRLRKSHKSLIFGREQMGSVYKKTVSEQHLSSD
ncbi:hypothetical protein N8Z63_06895, partial [Octadecabacter sp.]|nr:hypothetical protein [Octadecabacter sp.]